MCCLLDPVMPVAVGCDAVVEQVSLATRVSRVSRRVGLKRVFRGAHVVVAECAGVGKWHSARTRGSRSPVRFFRPLWVVAVVLLELRSCGSEMSS